MGCHPVTVVIMHVHKHEINKYNSLQNWPSRIYATQILGKSNK